MQINAPSPPPARPTQPTFQADRLEAAFLEEMIKHVGPRSAQDATQAGESQFQTFLDREYAGILAARLDLRLGRGASHE